MITALSSKHYNGCHKAADEKGGQRTPEKEIWRGKCGQKASGLAGGRWRRQHKTELDGDKWFVACDTRGVKRDL